MRFEALRETLLKGGVAPRHVRRYLAELSEHLDDLTAQQREVGYDAEDAAIRARARLGDDDRLAQAMLEQPGMRSWPARLPWLVFVALPPAATLLLGLKRLVHHDHRREIVIGLLTLVWVFNVLGVVILVASITFNVLGDGLRKLLDVRSETFA